MSAELLTALISERDIPSNTTSIEEEESLIYDYSIFKEGVGEIFIGELTYSLNENPTVFSDGDDSEYCYISHVEILASHRREGHGSHMIKEFVEFIKNNHLGINFLVLSASNIEDGGIEDLKGVVSFYSSLGFVSTCEVSSPSDLIDMCLEL